MYARFNYVNTLVSYVFFLCFYVHYVVQKLQKIYQLTPLKFGFTNCGGFRALALPGLEIVNLLISQSSIS